MTLQKAGCVEWSTPRNAFKRLGSVAERGCHGPDMCVAGAPEGYRGHGQRKCLKRYSPDFPRQTADQVLPQAPGEASPKTGPQGLVHTRRTRVLWEAPRGHLVFGGPLAACLSCPASGLLPAGLAVGKSLCSCQPPLTVRYRCFQVTGEERHMAAQPGESKGGCAGVEVAFRTGTMARAKRVTS